MNPSGADCPLSTQPAACFAKLQESHILKANRHRWESIGSCHGCKYARINAEIAFTPDPDDTGETGKTRWVKVNPNDFLDKPIVDREGKFGPIPQDVCKAGHSLAKHGYTRGDRGRRCRLCERKRDNARSHTQYLKRKARKSL